MTKRKKKDFAPHIDPEVAPSCDAEGCIENGIYKAPRSRHQLSDYYFFCLDHVREHNSKWDYFSGMATDEIESFMHDAVTGHRPTWSREATFKNHEARLYEAVHEFLRGTKRQTTPPPPGLDKKMRTALALFEINYPYTLVELKRRYKLLVKNYHPDHNQGDRLAEEKFKAITVAYTMLERHIL